MAETFHLTALHSHSRKGSLKVLKFPLLKVTSPTASRSPNSSQLLKSVSSASFQTFSHGPSPHRLRAAGRLRQIDLEVTA